MADVLIRSLQAVGFDGHVCVIQEEEMKGFRSRDMKTRLPDLSPFRRTLFLDSDVIAQKSFWNIWALLDREDLYMAHDLHSTVEKAIADSTSRCEMEEREETAKVCCPSQPFFNTGVILYKPSAIVSTYFNVWHEEWERFKLVDQFAAARAMTTLKYFPSLLEARYNAPVRYAYPMAYPEAVFLHCWGLPRNERYKPLASRLLPQDPHQTGRSFK